MPSPLPAPPDDGRFRLLVDSVEDYAILMLDPAGRVVSWNAGAERLKGWSAEEIVGRHFSCFYPDEEVKAGRPERALELTAARGRLEDEGWRLRADGSRFWANVVITALRDGDGTLQGFGKVTRDLTERWAAETQVRASEARFRAMVEHLPGSVMVVDSDLQVTYAAGRAWDEAGIAAADAVGGKLDAMQAGRSAGPTLELARAALDGETREATFVSDRTGRSYWLTAVAQRLGGAEVDSAILLAQDTTARVRAEERFGELLEAAPDGMVIVDSSGTITLANRQTEIMLGYAHGELEGATIETLVPEGSRRGHPDLRRTFAHTRAARPMGAGRELAARHKDGSEIPVEISLSPLGSGDGRVVIAAIRDVSERRLADQRLRVAEERFRTAFSDAPVGLAVTTADLDRRDVTAVNHAMCELTGRSEADLRAMSFAELTAPAERADERRDLEDLLAGRIERIQCERRYLHAGGHAVEAAVGVSLVRDETGAPLHLITQAHDISARKHFERQLVHMAEHDPLTGLPNRKRFEEELARHVARVQRYGPTGAVLMIDLDHFKHVNDELGHDVGDDVLIAVARILQARVRETDVVARLGGDEFVILMSDGDEDAAQVLAGDLSDRIRRSTLTSKGAGAAVTASIGIGVFDACDEPATTTVMTRADAAMYTAKENGRDRISAGVDERGEHVRRTARLTLHNQIDRALRADDFVLHAQPVMNIASGSVTRYELLLRMLDERGTEVQPGTFLYVAERFDQIAAIDRWVVSQATELLARIGPSDPGLHLEVNLSGRSIGDHDIVDHIALRLRETGADPSRLIFEITETAAVENIQEARSFALELGGLGCRFALDDFGAGFGSFYYLKHLPFDYLKIDGEFVRQCTESRTDQLVIQACVQLAQGLGKQTIAEYVEDADTLRLLHRLGVDHAQGFHVGRPTRLQDVAALHRPSRRTATSGTSMMVPGAR